MREIRIAPPRVDGDRVEFAWHVEPPSPLFLRTSFFLRFPPGIDPSSFPPRLLWLLAMLSLHPLWVLLRPCRIVLPIRLDEGEREFWLRLLDATLMTLEGNRGGHDIARTIEIVEEGERLVSVERLPERSRCAAAFSGGKDSLLQAGLLSELLPEVLLVTTTSPMPPLHDHVTERRRHVMREIVARRKNVTLVEIESDLRSSWRNDFPPTVGYKVAVNELVDTFLYLSSMLAAAWSHGATHLFLASEAEVQENIDVGGMTVQHPHAMYSVATQTAVSALLSGFGIRYGSLSSPLRSEQVQALLWTRYPDLCDLQYSCWRVGPGDAACSSCSQCLRVAFGALAIGESPQRMGIDLVKLIGTMHRWEPRLRDALLPGDRVAVELHAQTVRSIVATPVGRFASALASSKRLMTPRGLLAVDRFRRMHRRLRRAAVAPSPGYRAAYLEHVDPLVRERLAAVYAASFTPELDTVYEAMRQRGTALARWIAQPLQTEIAEEVVA